MTLAQVIRTVRPVGGGLAAVRRTPPESGGMLIAVACVAIAVVLYAIVSLVWGPTDDSIDGPLASRAADAAADARYWTSRLDGFVLPNATPRKPPSGLQPASSTST